MPFTDLRLSEPILRAVRAEGYETPSPIQSQAIPPILAGRDLLGSAQTGTGKTAAFALPVLERFAESMKGEAKNKRARCLVLAPTRELARQIDDSFRTYGKHLRLRTVVIYGGVGQNPQVKSLRQGVDVIVATPGRLQDLMEQGHVDLSAIEVLILDEADRMLDMGFIHDIKRIVAKLPDERQTLMFSATMPTAIQKLAQQLLTDPATVQIEPETPTVEAIDQSVYFVTKKNKPGLLAHVLGTAAVNRALVFTRTKHGADRVAKRLRAQHVGAETIHGNKSQNARQRALKAFTSGKTKVLVATDIAARGIDVDGITHVINYDLTHEPETYVHRIGRTARAGASGHAISFCDHDEREYLADIEQMLRRSLTVRTDAPDHAEIAAPPMAVSSGKSSPKRNDGRQKSGSPSRQSRKSHSMAEKSNDGKPSRGQGGKTRRRRRRKPSSN